MGDSGESSGRRRPPWEDVEPLFHDALAQPPSVREAFVRDRCGDDPALADEVLSLLRATGEELPGIDGGVRFTNTDAAPGSGPAVAVGDRVGPYLLTRPLGQGGMGEVFLAERADGEYQQQVAIKFLKPAAAEHFERFRNERQILAGLSHPGIARLLDGGVSDSGRPYMVMEHVDGEPVTDHVRRHRLGVDAVLDLFDGICAAVAEAHANLVIHRDLKPANILVTGDGGIKLLDFGVAKLLSGDRLDSDATRATPLTPSHAAPEQLCGQAVTTATDVYALGVVLYELLTGVSPWAGLTDLPLGVAVNRLLETDAEPASRAARRAGQPGRAKALSGDLDAVLARAMRKSPAQRYRTVEALCDDLRRHRQGFAVSARYGNRWYLFRRALRRYRWALLATGVLLALLSGFTLRLGIEAERAQRAEQLARAEAEAANAVTDYLVSLFETANPASSSGQPIEPKALVDAGLKRLDAQLGHRPQIQARLLTTLSTLYTELGHEAEAVHTAERALIAIGNHDGIDRAEALIGLGRAYDRTGRYDDAINALLSAQTMLSTRAPADDNRRLQLQWYLGQAYVNRDQVDQGLPILAAAHATAQASKPDAELTADLASSLAVAHALDGRAADAVPMQRAAMQRFRRLLGDEHPKTIDSIATLGHIAYFGQQLELAREQFDRAIALALPIYGQQSAQVLNMQRGLANTLSDLGKVREAIAIEREIVELHRIVSGENPGLGTSLINLATDLNRWGDYAAAEHAARRAVGLLDPEGEPTEYLRAQLTIAEALNRMGHTEQALALLDDEVPAAMSGLMGDGFRAVRHFKRFDAMLDLSRLDEAAAELSRAAELLSATQPGGSRVMMMLLFRRGQLAAARGETERGLQLMQQADDGIRALGLRSPTQTLEIQAEIANALIDRGESAAAHEVLERLIPRAEQQLAPTSTVRLAIRRAQRRLHTGT